MGHMRSHAENRSKVCATCWRRAQRKFTPALVNIIRIPVFLDYSFDDPRVPNGLFGSCRVALGGLQKGTMSQFLHLPSDLDCGVITGLRSGSKCICKICRIARRVGHREKRKPGRKSSRTIGTQLVRMSQMLNSYI